MSPIIKIRGGQCLINAHALGRAMRANRPNRSDTDDAADVIDALLNQRNELLSALKGMLALDPTFTKTSMEITKSLADEGGSSSCLARAVYEARLAIAAVEDAAR